MNSGGGGLFSSSIRVEGRVAVMTARERRKKKAISVDEVSAI